MRGHCNGCGRWDKDLRRFIYRKKDHGNVCRKCRKQIQAIDMYIGDLFKRMEDMGRIGNE